MNKPLYRRYWYLIIGAICIATLTVFVQQYRDVTFFVMADELLTDEVVYGDLIVSVRGYGQLSSTDVYWVGAESEGRVVRVLVKPGDRVEERDILVELANRQLLRQLRDAELEFEAKRAESIANRVANESELLGLQAAAATAEIEFQAVQMDLDAKSQLMVNGSEIVSRLDFEQTQLSARNLLQFWEVQKERLLKKEESTRANQEAEQARLVQAENDLNNIEEQVANLSIRANVGGTVQEMSLELGQQIIRGENITRIAKPDQLVAEIQIQELQVNDIQLGMPALIDTRTSVIEGIVSRIDPTVIDGSVLIEIEFLENLPAEVRPDLNVEGTINISDISETLYIRRPVFARAFTPANIYRLNDEEDIAERIQVRYGQASSNYIEILEGAEAGDRFIISDSSSWDNHDRILIR